MKRFTNILLILFMIASMGVSYFLYNKTNDNKLMHKEIENNIETYKQLLNEKDNEINNLNNELESLKNNNEEYQKEYDIWKHEIEKIDPYLQ